MSRIYVTNIFEYIQLLRYFEEMHYHWISGLAVFDCTDDVDFPLEIQAWRNVHTISKNQNPVPELSYTVDEYLQHVGAGNSFNLKYGVGDLVIYRYHAMLYVGIISSISCGIGRPCSYSIAANAVSLHYGVTRGDIIAKLDDSLKFACHIAVGIGVKHE